MRSTVRALWPRRQWPALPVVAQRLPYAAHHLQAPCAVSHRRHCASLSHRNVGIIAHIDAGKTTTTERMMVVSGVTKVAGEVDSGNTVMDFLEQERERGITIQAAATNFSWAQHEISLIDTPGHVDFTIEVERAVRVLDGAVLIVDAVAGAQAQTETVWRQARSHSVPAIAFINKLDRKGADLRLAAQSLEGRLRVAPLLLQMPISQAGGAPSGLVNLVDESLVWWLPGEQLVGGTASPQRTPARQLCVAQRVTEKLPPGAPAVAVESVREARAELIEKVAELEEDDFAPVSELYLSEQEVPADTLRAAIRRLTLRGRAVPTLCGASLHGIGVEPLLDAIVHFLPSPAERPPPMLHPPHARVAGSWAGRAGAATDGGTEVDGPVQLSSAADAVALAFKVVHESISRRPLVWLRVYHGEIRVGGTLANTCTGSSERSTRLLRMRGAEATDVDVVRAGELCAAVGLKNTRTGDTLIARPAAGCSELRLPGVAVPQPVFFRAVEAHSSSQQAALDAALAGIQLEDPSITVAFDRITGQQLVGGMGELHLEVLAQRLAGDWRLNVRTGAMRVAYREGVTLPVQLSSSHATQLSSGGDIEIDLSVLPVAEGEVLEVRPREKGQIHPEVSATEAQHADLVSVPSADSASDSDRRLRIELGVGVREALHRRESRALLDGLRGAAQFGDLLGFPVHGTRVLLKRLRKPVGVTAEALGAAAAEALEQALRSAGSVLLEPVMRVEVDLPEKHLGPVLSELTGNRRATIEGLEAAEAKSSGQHVVHAFVPLACLIGYASSLRSLTHGDAALSMEFSHYAQLDLHEQQQVLLRLRGY